MSGRMLVTCLVVVVALGAIALVLVTHDSSTPSGSPVAVVLQPDGCLNPPIRVDDSNWQAVDFLPRGTVSNSARIAGTLFIDGDRAEFVADSGDLSISYIRRVGIEPQCAI